MLTHNDICQAVKTAAPKYGIKNVYYFGSYAKGTSTDDSDLDLLVEFDRNPVSIFTIASFAADLEKIILITVDVLRLPLPPNTYLRIDKVVKCYGTKR